MRIAILTPYLPAPANTGGRIRMYRFARTLARDHEVLLFACANQQETRSLNHTHELKIYSGIFSHTTDTGTPHSWSAGTRVRRSCPWRLARALWLEHHRKRFDAVVAEHCYSAASAFALDGVPLVLDEHNIESRYHEEYLRTYAQRPSWQQLVSLYRHGFTPREIAKLKRWEKKVWERAKLVVCVSSQDREHVRTVAANQENLVVIENGAPVSEIPFVPPSERTSNDILFVGLMAHAPNILAAKFLALDVLPLVKKQIPSARVVICGRAPTSEVTALANESVIVTGTVPSVLPYLQSAGVYANALFTGAGTSLKVPEAMACGIPLVSTTLGVRGFSLEENREFLPAETANQFAQNIIAVLLQRQKYNQQAQAARHSAERFDWEPLATRFANAVIHHTKR